MQKERLSEMLMLTFSRQYKNDINDSIKIANVRLFNISNSDVKIQTSNYQICTGWRPVVAICFYYTFIFCNRKLCLEIL